MTTAAMIFNKRNILDFLEINSQAKILDLGCDNGSWTTVLGQRVGSKHLYGIDIVKSRLSVAKKAGVKTKVGDLNKKLPYKTNTFDVVQGNQIIEHISNLDLYVSEIYRVLKPGGYVVMSTENASSWHNIFASIMGWQIFSLTNISAKQLGIGNPLAVLKGRHLNLSSWTHKTIFNYLGLKEFFQMHGFKDIQIKGSGYHPLPVQLGNIDVRHSHFITIKGRK